MGENCVANGSLPPYGDFAADSWDECTLAMHASSVSRARKFVLDRLSRWELAPDVEDDVVLVVSELVTNAIVHTVSDEVTCHLRITEDSVYIAVADQGSDPIGPQVRATAVSECGRGLQLVNALAEDWGVVRNDGQGRVVWAVFRATQTAELAPSSTPAHSWM